MANESANVTTGTLLAEAFAVFRRNWPLLLISGAAEALILVAQDIENRAKLGGAAGIILFFVVTLIADIAVQGIIARKVFLREEIVDAQVPARFGAFVGVSIVVLLGIIFGTVLLIVPGILLALRWTLAANFTLTRDMDVREALHASAVATDGHRGEIFGAYFAFGLAAYGPVLLLGIVAGGLEAMNSADPSSVLGAIRTAWAIFTGMAGLALGIGIFSALVGRSGHLREVFA